jgi:hypothetical protein
LDTQVRLGKVSLVKESIASKKEFYQDMPIVKSRGKEWCVPADGSAWLEFDRKNAKKEEIILK